MSYDNSKAQEPPRDTGLVFVQKRAEEVATEAMELKEAMSSRLSGVLLPEQPADKDSRKTASMARAMSDSLRQVAHTLDEIHHTLAAAREILSRTDL